MIRLSIVIPVFNKLSFTQSCLRDLFHLDKNEIEIIVVDNASTDDTQKELSSITRQNFHYLRNEQNFFHSKASNMGFAHSKGDNVLFLNNDIRIKSNYTDWTNLVIEQCDNLVGLSMGQLDNGFNFIREEKKELSGNSYMSGWFLASSRKNWDIIATNNGGKVWNELLPFYFNDCDLSFRVKKLGIPLKVISPPIVHFGKISASQLNVSSLYLTGRKAFLEIWEHKR